MSNQDYEIIYREGDKVCFETRFPEFKYQPNYGGGGYWGIQYATGLSAAKKIKGEIILIHDDEYHVLVGKAVYICEHSILKPVVKPGEFLIFEAKKKEDPFYKISIQDSKPNFVRKFIDNIQSSDYYPIFIIWLCGFFAYLLITGIIVKYAIT